MGTRNLTIVVKDGKYQVTQYGQWDGHPTGQGHEILRFLRETGLRRLEEKLPRCRWITPEEVEVCRAEVERRGGPVSRLYPLLSRDTGAEILQLIADSEEDEILLADNLEFAADSPMCEYAYVLDLDTERLEIYKGFNKIPLGLEDRFHFLAGAVNRERSVGVYEPVRLWKSFSIWDLPEDFEFLESEGETEEQVI